MNYEGMDPDKLHKIVQSAINPLEVFRRSFCQRVVESVNSQFGTEGLYDLLLGIDAVGNLGSVVVINRDEIDNYMFSNFGTFDEFMYDKIIMSEEWADFMNHVMAEAGATLGKIIDDAMENN